MSTISGIGGASSAWSDMSAQRASMRDKLFSKVDSDGSGQVDAGELQSMIAKLSGDSTSTDAASTKAADLLKKMDTDGDGSLSVDELDAGVRALMGPPPSTMQFAQQRASDAVDASSDIPGAAAAGDSSSSASNDPLDTNGDGIVSMQERLAGEMSDLMQQLAQASDVNGDGQVSGSGSGSEGDTTQSSPGSLASAFDTVLQSLQSSTATVSAASSSSSSSSADGSSSGGDADSSAQGAARLAQRVMDQYARFSDATSQSSSSLNVSLAV